MLIPDGCDCEKLGPTSPPSKKLRRPVSTMSLWNPWRSDEEMVMVVVRGDHRGNEIKLRSALRGDFRPAVGSEIEDRIG